MLRAAGDASAAEISEIGKHVEAQRGWPSARKGGKIVDVYKRKGGATIGDNSRGFLYVRAHV